MSALAQMLLAAYGSAAPGASGLQDLTAYTRVNPAGTMSVTSSRVSFNVFSRIDAEYLYQDFGAAHFNGNFQVDFESTITADTSGAWVALAMLSDAVGTAGSVSNAAIVGYYYDGTTRQLFLIDKLAGASTSSPWAGAAVGTTYYMRLRRDAAAGAHGTIYLHIASSAANRSAGTWIATQSIALTLMLSYRYLYALAALGSGSGTCSGWNQNVSVS